jgi:hypothetical protein
MEKKYHCEHGTYKYKCKDCGGSSICEHGRERYKCKECKGSSLCIHDKQRFRCKDCKGIGICEHGKEKHYCKDCEGNGICEHGKLKVACKECGGSGLCIHSKRKQFCKDCGGSWICIHNKRKDYCKECDGRELCKSKWCSVTKNKKYQGYCLFCYIHLFPDNEIVRNYKTKEKSVFDYIKTYFSDFSWVSDKKIENGCSQKRPDLLLDLGFQIIIIEIDENQHNNYETTCENKRLMEISQDLHHRNTIFIRFNPDSYTYNNKKITSCWSINKNGIMSIKKSKTKEWDQRLIKLNTTIKYWCENKSEKMIHMEYLFYDKLCTE